MVKKQDLEGMSVWKNSLSCIAGLTLYEEEIEGVQRVEKVGKGLIMNGIQKLNNTHNV